MRKIDLTNYFFADDQEYDVNGTIVGVLFSGQMKLGVREVLNNDRIARIAETSGNSLLLEEADYQCLKRAVETFEGYGRADAEFITRIMDAPEIEVKEAA